MSSIVQGLLAADEAGSLEYAAKRRTARGLVVETATSGELDTLNDVTYRARNCAPFCLREHVAEVD